MKRTKLIALLLCMVMVTLVIPMVGAEEADTISGNLVAKVDHFGVKDSGKIPALPEDYEGYIGTIVQVGEHALTVTSLGRLFYEGNAQEHTLKIVNAATGADVEGATVTVSGGVVDQFTYGTLATPVTLEANTTYYLLSSERVDGDNFSDWHDVMYSGSAAVCAGYVMQDGEGYTTFRFSNSGYVSLDMQFTYTPVVDVELDEQIEAFMDINYTIIRNDYHSFIGIKFITGNDTLYVTELGRIYLDGNVQEHAVKLVDGVTFEDVPGANVIVYGGEHEKITYVKLETPVKLQANHPYLLMSREYYEGDTWFEVNAQYLVTDDDDIMVMGGTYFITGYEDIIMLDCGFVGVNMKYTKVKESEPPATDPVATEPQNTEPKADDPTEPATSDDPTDDPGFPVWIPIVIVIALAAVVVVIVAVSKKKKA